MYHILCVNRINSRQRKTPITQITDTPPSAASDKRLDALASSLAPRAKSLIVTFLGDALSPHASDLWLGSLIALMAPFGINQRAVRTGVLRLVRDDWLVARQRGRRSYYSLTESGRRRIEGSERRMYPNPRWDWDGRWHMVFAGLGEIADDERARLRRTLRWLGFGAVAGGVFAHPRADLDGLAHAIDELGLAGEVVTMRAEAEAILGAGPRHDLLGRAWDLEELAVDYKKFVDHFGVFEGTAGQLSPADAFTLRILLMHEYRRVLLRDPGLPAELLPSDWPGMKAWTLARGLYRKVAAASQVHLLSIAQTEAGTLPPLAASFGARFGGIEGFEKPTGSSRRAG